MYYGGVAGDDKSVLRKMRTGQIDGAPLGLELMSRMVREALVLASPGLFQNYKQVDAVRRELTPRFDEEAYKNGFKVMGWGDAGRLRLFGKTPVQSIADFKRMRPWLYTESEMGKEFYKQIGATGVPLELSEVYGAMQTCMIDTYWSSAVLAVALQWHRGTRYMSQRGLGFISGAFVFRRQAWDALPPVVQESMLTLSEERRVDAQRRMRKYDERSFTFLAKRGVTAVTAKDPAEWWDAGHELRKRMIGRVYTRALVGEAEKIAMKYADAEQLAHWKHE
jgi:TRAP-type C4-dicarboxylate transport system substrate-binding protein